MKITQTATDEVLGHLFNAVVDEMSWILLRSAYTTFVKETQDFATAIVSVDGEVAAYPRGTGVTSLVAAPMKAGIDGIDRWEPGDIMVANDPYTTAGMVTHLNDVYMFKPIFADDQLICFAWAFIHCTDVSGAVPGSIDMTNNEIFQEGLRLRPVKLFRAGERDEALWNIMSDNSRIPALNQGDISALVSVVNKAEVRLQGLMEKYGKEAVSHAIDYALDHTQELSRKILAEIPAGQYRFTEYFEDDYVSDVPVKLEVCLTSRGDGTVELDFTGSDPQVKAALNIPSGGQKHHPFLSRTFINYIVTKDPEIQLNAGLLRNVDLVLPESSVVNCSYPAAVGMRAVTSLRLHDAVLGCLMQAVDDVPAGGCSQVAITYISTAQADPNGAVVVANPIQGGSGGSPLVDGLSGSDRPLAYLRNVPTEILESEAPVIVHRFALAPDSEGPGEFRGGFGLEYDLEVLHPEAILVMRGKDRHRFAAWGAMGGGAGTPCSNDVMTPSGETTYLGKVTVYRPELGHVVRLRGGGGGGYGDPLDRAPAKVAKDVADGLVSWERARDVYGVVLEGSAVDPDATIERRASLRTDADRPLFDLGAGRRTWEEGYKAAADRISGWLWTLPANLRSFGREQAWSRMTAKGAAPYSASDAERCIAEIEDLLRFKSLL